MLMRIRAKRESEIQVRLTVELQCSGFDSKSEGLSFLLKTLRGYLLLARKGMEERRNRNEAFPWKGFRIVLGNELYLALFFSILL